jgi:UDP-N-acetylglucosamine diphosphorylase / glucose-1-phosphate thymidylyltransferase / UDP-N-acetylgalactosamine diphosphorylase / glucosamine-1-phosphate N-acetyltransferase / galactosamine-1-phosphate N-acetyltransferase
MRRIAFFEDATAGQLRPLTRLRPVFELLCGHFSVRERWVRFGDVHEWGAWLRPELVATYAEQHPEARINDATWLSGGATTFINGRWLPPSGAQPVLAPDAAAYVDDTLVAMTIEGREAVGITWDNLGSELARSASGRRRVEAGGRLIRYPWDLVTHNAAMLREDFARRKQNCGRVCNDLQVVVQGEAGNVYIDPTAQVDPFVVIDARHGPVWIDAGARILPFTRIEGPALIGRESQVFRAHVREGTTIGPVCRVGGEIEESILHGYVNKYHDGFLGHSYVCPWVNLGALTSNSDLKNDYSNVRVPVGGESLDTGSAKVGCFIGDHSKAAIGSLLNTGTIVGVMSMLLPDGGLLPKFVPSFSWHRHGRIESSGDVLERGIEAARIAMNRRNSALTTAGERLLRDAYGVTQAERDGAVARAARSSASRG